MEPMMGVAIIFAALNSIVLVALLYFYGRIALRTKASYSYGLLIFAIFLLAHNLLTVYSYFAMWPLFDPQAVPFLSSIAALEFVGLIVLIRITI